MKLQHLRAITTPWLLPAATAALAAAIFIADTITDLELAVPAFYTAVVLLSVRRRKVCRPCGLNLPATWLIADVQMPNMSGLALYGHLVAVGTPIPTILITAYPDDTIRTRALNAGVTSYLTKPFSEKEPGGYGNRAVPAQILG